MYYYAFVCEFLCIPYLNDKALWVAQLPPIIYLLQVIVFWLLWFCGVFTISFVSSLPFLLILSGQAKYFFVPFKGTRKPNQTTHTQNNNNNKTNKTRTY